MGVGHRVFRRESHSVKRRALDLPSATVARLLTNKAGGSHLPFIKEDFAMELALPETLSDEPAIAIAEHTIEQDPPGDGDQAQAVEADEAGDVADTEVDIDVDDVDDEEIDDEFSEDYQDDGDPVGQSDEARPTLPKTFHSIDSEILAEIRLTEQECESMEAMLESLKEEVRDAKKAYDKKCDKLRKLCRSLTEQLPLFDQPVQNEPKPEQPKLTDGEQLTENAEKLTEKPTPARSETPTKRARLTNVDKIQGFEVGDIVGVSEEQTQPGDTIELDEGEIWVYDLDQPGDDFVVNPGEYEYVVEDGLLGETRPTPETSPTPPADDDDTSWRSVPSEDLGLSKIKGFGKKKLSTFLEQCPTLGHIEDLRAEASKQFKPFAAMLTKGIGEGLASEIEEKLLDFYKNRSK